MAESACIAGAHTNVIKDIAARGNLLAAASNDKTQAVWDSGSRERISVHRGHSASVHSVNINDRNVVTTAEHYI